MTDTECTPWQKAGGGWKKIWLWDIDFKSSGGDFTIREGGLNSQRDRVKF